MTMSLDLFGIDKHLEVIYQYDTLPKAFRVQVVHIWSRMFAKQLIISYDAPTASPPDFFSDAILKKISEEHGISFNVQWGNDNIECLANYFISLDKITLALQVIQIAFHVAETHMRPFWMSYKQLGCQNPDDAISDLNRRFREHGIGYQYKNGAILKISSPSPNPTGKETPMDDESARLLRNRIRQPPQAQPTATTDAKKVFVIHGRNDKLRDSMFDFLRALHLHPMEWSEAKKLTGKGTPYTGEILDAAFAHAHAIIAVMSGDDEARLRQALAPSEAPEPLTPQPRPNVLFEAGMAMGKNPDRVVMVEVGPLRGFSDIHGRHVVRLDDTIKLTKEFVEQLKTIGCAVETSGSDWLRNWNFLNGSASRTP